jgi:hypothetical protein
LIVTSSRPTQSAGRGARTGKFVREAAVERHPETTETQQL